MSPTELISANRNDMVTMPLALVPASQDTRKPMKPYPGDSSDDQAALDRGDFRHPGKPRDTAADEHHDQHVTDDRDAEPARRFWIAADRPHFETEARPRHGQRIEHEATSAKTRPR